MLWTPGTPGNPSNRDVRLLALFREQANWRVIGSDRPLPGDLWRGEVLPPPSKRFAPDGSERRCSSVERLAVPYPMSIKTPPGLRLSEHEIRQVQDAAAQRFGLDDFYLDRLTDRDDSAEIDAEIIEDMIADGEFTLAEFERFCNSLAIPAHDEAGDLAPAAAQAFMEHKFGQEVFTVRLPTTEDAASTTYLALAALAQEQQLRLRPAMGGEIDLANPGRLPPHWHRFLIGKDATDLESLSSHDK
ncbi:MAG: hypothetical protein KDB14_31515 [Planctomycetales bacterium]|nr:hypothetical protein [Planctomycetales bacterium]